MALSATKLICFICLAAFLSVQIQSRESQFFSKVPSSNGNNEEQSLSKQVHEEPTSFVPKTQKTTTLNKQRGPTFIPETQNGYGLHGQENNQFQYEPYTTPITSIPTGTFEPHTTPATTTTSAALKYEPYTTTPTTSFSYPNKYNNNNNNGFETEQEESLGDSKFQESGYTGNNVEKQLGMTDTRYLENGRYYYHSNNENNYYPNQYQQKRNSRGDYNGNTYEYNNNNSMEGYQNEGNEFDELP